MICNETGVLPESQYFFFTPSPVIERYYFYLLVCGHFNCELGYHITRKGNTSPLLIYIIDGQLNLDYENREYQAKKGDILLIDCNKPHTYYSDPNCNFLFFHFNGSDSIRITNHLIKQNEGALFRLEINQTISQLMYELVTKLYYDQAINDIDLSIVVYNCLCLMQAINEILPVQPSLTSSVISDSIYYIRNNINRSLSIKDLSSQAHLSPYYYAHLFKRETGSSPIEYIAQLKIKIAKTMLKTSQITISEIAESLGYSSSSSFINAFTSRIGTSPMKFRNSSDKS